MTGHKRRPLEAGVEAVRTQSNASNTNSGRGQRGFGAQISISGGRPQQNNYIDIDRDHVVSARPRLDDYNDSGRNRKRMAPRGDLGKMPSGDSQRTWFPEMVARLRVEWREGMSIPVLIGLRDELNETLHRIRAGRNIQTPIITCPRCGIAGHAAEPRVSVHALILALARFQIASKDQTRALEKEWAAYRKQHRLDIEGRALVEVPQSCPH